MPKAYEMPRFAITGMPSVDLSAKRHTFITVNSSGALAVPAAGARCIGVLQTPGIVGEPCNVMVSGVSFVYFGATVAAGQEIEVDVAGKAIPLNTGKSNGICLVGGAAGAIGSVLIK